jgi:hypothetical protein
MYRSHWKKRFSFSHKVDQMKGQLGACGFHFSYLYLRKKSTSQGSRDKRPRERLELIPYVNLWIQLFLKPLIS